MSLKIAVAGAAGRMGRFIISSASTDDAISIIGGTERPESGMIGKDLGLMAGVDALNVVSSLSAQDAGHGADAWIDFTSPLSTLEALDALVGTSVRVAIIGTTGFNDEEDAALRAHSDRFVIVKAGNFSLGVNLMNALIEQAAQRLGDDWDIEILETHHRRKVDAPSGTALMMGEAAARGRGAPLNDLKSPPYDGITGAREAGKIGFSVRRAGGVVGDHEALFASESEILSLRHTALDRSVFARGALHAAKWASQQPVGFYDMQDVLKI